MPGRSDPFEASAAALGYLYQLRMALLVCVKHLETGLDWTVAVEAGDDIETVRDDSTDLMQLKHRAPGTRMTDASSDLWKTLRIWATALTNGDFELPDTNLFLLTTGEVPRGTAGFHLVPERLGGPRDERLAHSLLQKTRERSHASSAAALANFAAWDALGTSGQKQLLTRIQVLDEAGNIEETWSVLRGRAALAVGHSHAESFLQRLEGWFLERCISHLANRSLGPVTGAEFDEAFELRRNQFGPDALPVDADIIALAADAPVYAEKTFVRQLEIAGIGNNRIRMAVRDYIRAYLQRSRWAEENLLRPGEIGDYERLLVEEWERRFYAMVDDIGPDKAEAKMRDEAKELYRWVEHEARYRIRPSCDEPFISIGSYQMLSDEQRVGWHPEFTARLMTVLEPAAHQ